MQDADLFLELAAIAGVFVGFGALIAVRGGGASDPFEVAYMRGVVSMGLLTVVVALAPVTFARYALTDHQIWALSSALALIGLLGAVAANARTPEWSSAEPPARGKFEVVALTVWMLSMFAGMVLTPIVILLGVVPDLEPALYFTAVVLILLWDAWLLLQMVFRARPTAGAQGASSGAEPAPGGSCA